MNAQRPKNVRCAIYTRKSSEEGLEQEFNSLDAQREACAAYILSQASEGWSLIDESYDDGGISGGSLERPGLQRLLADIEAGLLDIVVVYKVDRLTRSLLDFAKLVETMDKAEVSFVSVTQSFNTTNSMGRLTLNMLLSFAQFEREVTAERIRDKIAASKAKGMWMGGVPPLGYKPDGRSLKIVGKHAKLIRSIYSRYLELGNVRLLSEDLEHSNIRSPIRKTAKGKAYGGCVISRGQLYTILRNPIYAGLIGHKGEIFDGLHKAIIDRATWDAAQEQLANNRQGPRRQREPKKALLAGLLVDEAHTPFHSSHTKKGKREYCYYVSAAGAGDAGAGDAGSGAKIRIPASDIERVIREEVASRLSDPLTIIDPSDVSPREIALAYDKASELAASIRSPRSKLIRMLLSNVTVGPNALEIELNRSVFASELGVEENAISSSSLAFTVDAKVKRPGQVLRIIEESGLEAHRAMPNLALVGLIAKAHEWWNELCSGEIDIAKFSRQEGVTASWMTRVVRLAFLSPEVVEAVLDGRAKANLDTKSFLAPNAIPACWDEQRAKFLASQTSHRSLHERMLGDGRQELVYA